MSWVKTVNIEIELSIVPVVFQLHDQTQKQYTQDSLEIENRPVDLKRVKTLTKLREILIMKLFNST